MMLVNNFFRCAPMVMAPSREQASSPVSGLLDTFMPSLGEELGSISRQALQKLCNPQPAMTPELQKAYDRAVKRFGKIPGAEISVSASPDSGGKPVVLVRNHAADPRHLKVQTHFHGFEHMDKQVNYDKRIGDTVKNAWDHDPNMVFVFPESTDEGKGQAKSGYENIKSVTGLTRHAVEAAGLPWSGVEKTILSGHSAGGSPVAKALARAMKGQDGPFSRVELYDAAVASQGNHVTDADRQGAQAYARAHRDQMLLVPGVMRSSWEEYIPRSQWTHGYGQHFDPVWTSLGQERNP